MNAIVAQMEILRHMLGMQSHTPMREWGWRNYFNSTEGEDFQHLRALETQGLVRQYRPGYWSATEAGMQAAGLPHKKRLKLLVTEIRSS